MHLHLAWFYPSIIFMKSSRCVLFLAGAHPCQQEGRTATSPKALGGSDMGKQVMDQELMKEYDLACERDDEDDDRKFEAIDDAGHLTNHDKCLDLDLRL